MNISTEEWSGVSKTLIGESSVGNEDCKALPDASKTLPNAAKALPNAPKTLKNATKALKKGQFSGKRERELFPCQFQRKKVF